VLVGTVVIFAKVWVQVISPPPLAIGSRLLGLDCRRLSSTNEGGAKPMGVMAGHVMSGTESLVNQFATRG
jgi:hypothetical protein